MSDLFGKEPPPSMPFRDIRNQRPSIAEDKAQLLIRLGVLMHTVPPQIANGSINITREWKAEQARCMKVAKNSRSSVNDLAMAIASMSRFTINQP